MRLLKLIKKAHLLIGVIDKDDTLEPGQVSDAIESLVTMIDDWGSRVSTIPAESPLTFAINSGQREYLLGPNGQWVTDVPTSIASRGVLTYGGARSEIVKRDFDHFVREETRQDILAIPSSFYFRQSHPEATIVLDCIPSMDMQITLYAKTVFPNISLLRTYESSCAEAQCTEIVNSNRFYEVSGAPCSEMRDVAIAAVKVLEADAAAGSACDVCEDAKTYELEYTKEDEAAALANQSTNCTDGNTIYPYTITVKSRPDNSATTVQLSLDGEIQLPPSYEKAILYGLAVEIAPEWLAEPSGLVMEQYISAMRAIKRKNRRPVRFKVDAELLSNSRNSGKTTGTGVFRR